MKVLELLSGTQSFGKVARKHGSKVLSIEINSVFKDAPYFLNQWTVDISKVTPEEIKNKLGVPNLIWASPTCTTHSIAAISTHRMKVPGKDYLIAKSIEAFESDEILRYTLHLIFSFPNAIFFIENPRGGMRKSPIMQEIELFPEVKRHTVTYCQYGDTRMKPTDIWTNCKTWTPRPMCKNGSLCHEAAPRGSRTGTQGLKGNLERSVIPEQLCEDIYRSIE